MTRSDDHFDEMTCLLYLEGQLEPARAREVAVHTNSCTECRALLRALEGEERWLRAALVEKEEALPAKLLDPQSWERIPWGWLGTLGFATAGVYTLWSSMIAPWFQQFNQAGFTQGNLLTMLFFSSAFWKGWGTMRSTMEFLAVATLGIAALALLRYHWRRSATVAIVMGLLACLLALPSPAAAAETRKGNPNYSLPAGEEMKHDLIVHANSARIAGTVDGDLYAFAQIVEITGHVTGDVIVFARELRILGQVDGNVRQWTQSLTINGTVGKNILAGCQLFELESRAQVGGNLLVFVGDLELNGRVEHDVMAFAGNTTLDGFVGGDLKLSGDRVSIDSTAEVRGRARVRASHEPLVSSGAKLASPLQFERRERRRAFASPHHFLWLAIGYGAALLFGVILILLFPAFVSDVVGRSHEAGPALGLGVLFLIATPVAALLACVTLFGLAVGLATLLFYVIALYASQIFVGARVGEMLLGREMGTGKKIAKLALGLFILRLLRLVPFAGGLVGFAVLIWGLGALVLAIHQALRPRSAAA